MPQRTITHEAFMVNLFALATVGGAIIQIGWIFDPVFARVTFSVLGTIVLVPLLRLLWSIQKKQISVCNLIVTYEDMRRSRVPSTFATCIASGSVSSAVVHKLDVLLRVPLCAMLVMAVFGTILWLFCWGGWLLGYRIHEPTIHRQLQESMKEQYSDAIDIGEETMPDP